MPSDIDRTDALVVGSSFLAALDASNADQAAALVNEEDLAAWFATKSTDRTYATRTLTIDDILKQDPDMPLHVAEYHLTRTQSELDRKRYTSGLGGEFGTIETAEELRDLGARAALAIYLDSLDPGVRYREATGNVEGQRIWRRRPIGVVYRDNDIAYVVYELLWAPTYAAEEVAHVLALHRVNGLWTIRLRGKAFEHSSINVVSS